MSGTLCEERSSDAQSGTTKTLPDERVAKILLVEDSPISQTVLRDMLQGLGHQVTLADNGRAAIKKCRERLYDVVLMDIQMPDVDGLEATRLIREAESGLGHRQKICALTAHATAADRTQCEQVGMDGFLVKPISLETLAKYVSETLGGQPTSGDTSPPLVRSSVSEFQNSNSNKRVVDSATEEETEFALDRAFENAPTWPDLLKLMNNNERLLKDVLALLIREAPKLGRNFRQAVKKNSMKDARRAVHTLKGNVRHVGLTRIAAFAEQLEYLAKDEERDKLQDAVDLVAKLCNAVADWSESVLNEHVG